MSQKVLTTVSAVALVLLVGCQQEQTKVAVRFAMPPGFDRFEFTPEVEAQFIETASGENATTYSDDGYEAATVNYDEVNALAHADRYHVAMWGSALQGQPVTYSNVQLEPGYYTFAMYEQEPATTVQGYLQLNPPNNTLLDTLKTWRSRIPALKEQLAFAAEFDLNADSDPDGFKAFKKQLKVIDKLQARIDWAIWWEERQWKKTQPRVQNFLSDAVVLLLPGDEGALTPQTKPAFCAADIEQVRTGEPVTRVVFVSDYDEVRTKAQLIDRMVGELTACKYVLREEIRRFEQRKRFLHVTDNVFHNDKAFVTNEVQLQSTLATVDEINRQLEELTTRRAALALAASFTAADESFAAFDARHRDLLQEQTYLESQKSRVEMLYEQASESSLKRIDYDAARQRYARALEDIDNSLTNLSETRLALSQLRDSGAVLHRQGNSLVLASSVIGAEVPSALRQVLEQGAVMTVRMQSDNSLFRPNGKTEVAQTASFGQ